MYLRILYKVTHIFLAYTVIHPFLMYILKINLSRLYIEIKCRHVFVAFKNICWNLPWFSWGLQKDCPQNGHALAGSRNSCFPHLHIHHPQKGRLERQAFVRGDWRGGRCPVWWLQWCGVTPHLRKSLSPQFCPAGEDRHPGDASWGPGRLGAVSGAQACGNQAVPQRIVFSFC